MNTPGPQTDNLWLKYWRALGGWEKLRSDEYLYAAILLDFVSFPLWTQPGWWDATINVMAILIGFSVSTFSVALTLADRLEKRLITRDSYTNSSPLLTLISGYVFYLLVGFVALGLSVIAKAWYMPDLMKPPETMPTPEYEFAMFVFRVLSRGLWFCCGFLFWYSLTCGVRCLMSVFRLSTVVQRVSDAEREINKPH